MSQQPIPVPSDLDLHNIQGDILSGLPKKTQTYIFFAIADATLFRSHLSTFIPLVTTVAQVLENRKAIEEHKRKGHKSLIPMVGINIAFSHKGFATMKIDDSNLANNEPSFSQGQKQDSKSLGDTGKGDGPNFVPDWDREFLEDIHGVVLIAGDSQDTMKEKVKKVKSIFGLAHAHGDHSHHKPSIKEIVSIRGDVRPGDQDGHEHFGFLDGISNPSVIGFDEPKPGPKPVNTGVLLLGHDGDPVSSRPEWTKDGSFLAFRLMTQNVPEFNEFLRKNPLHVSDLTEEEGSELLGARMVGRWKSGAPIDIAPLRDDVALAMNSNKINTFRFEGEANSQHKCPFAAHIRKTNPRADLEDKGTSIEKNRIMRRGIQFGPEVTKEEQITGKTKHRRGLLFACYQSSLQTGFRFLQESWANNATFPPEKTPQVPGLDAIIGQGSERKMSGIDPNQPATEIVFPVFVKTVGGEYFFSPGINGLKKTIAVA